MMREADRLSSVKEYYFSRKLREVAQLKASGKPIINLGIGSPDLAPAPEVIQALNEASLLHSSHGYQSYQARPELRQAMSDFYKTHFKVDLNPDNEILPMMGSKEAIMHISMAFLNPGDEVLIPNPGYPTYSSVTELVGATARVYTLNESTNWSPDLKQLAAQDLSKVKIMWVNYPNMPTGANASIALFEELVSFAKQHEILLINDNPYAFILNDNPQSLLEIEGALDHCMELNSLSKAFNMAGWRVGMLLGNAQRIKSVLKVKSNMDSGMFLGIQYGAIAALNLPNTWFEKINKVYAVRRDLAEQILDHLGCVYDKNQVGMFIWAKCGSEDQAKDLVDKLLYQYDVFITPGMIFGSTGNSYIRISLCSKEEDFKEVLKRIG
ncbi:MAG: pyridoxal phosphate-dependent aminotransferase [Flavobacteriaceae bacterium]